MAGTDSVSTPRASDNIATLTSFQQRNVRFEHAKTHTIRRCRLVYSTATTSAAHRRDLDTHEMRGVWRGGRNGLHAPATPPPVGLPNSYPHYRLGVLLLVIV